MFPTKDKKTRYFVTLFNLVGLLRPRAIAGGPLPLNLFLGLQPQPTTLTRVVANKKNHPAYVECPLLENTFKTPTRNQHFCRPCGRSDCRGSEKRSFLAGKTLCISRLQKKTFIQKCGGGQYSVERDFVYAGSHFLLQIDPPLVQNTNFCIHALPTNCLNKVQVIALTELFFSCRRASAESQRQPEWSTNGCAQDA